MKSNKLRIGKIVNTHGLKGEVKVYPYTDYPERFKEIQYLYMENSDEKISVENVKISKNMVILKLSSILTIDDAEKNRNNYLFIDRDNARKLDEDEHLIADLIGCKVYDVSEKRVAKMLKLCRRYLNWIQNSVFEGELTELQLRKFEYEARELLVLKEDSLIIFKSREERWLEKQIIGMEKNKIDNFL